VTWIVFASVQIERLPALRRSRGVGVWQYRLDEFGTNADARTCRSELFRGFVGLFARMQMRYQLAECRRGESWSAAAFLIAFFAPRREAQN
jgi:hypothetical protein